MANNYPTLDEMLLGLDAKALETEEAWQEVAKLILAAKQREADAINAAKLALEDGARFREKMMAVVALAKNEAAEIANQQPAAIAQ